MSEKPILIVHPKDSTTKFLCRIKNHLINNLEGQTHHFNVYPNDRSHALCIDRIQRNPENGVIIFMGHGRSDALSGAIGDNYNSLISYDAVVEQPEESYYKEYFIDKNNVDVFSKKKVFCLACNSKENIGHLAVEKGAKAFLGFGEIPTSLGEFDTGEQISKDSVNKMKAELTYIIKMSLVHAIKKRATFEELLTLIHFVTNQRISDILVFQKGFKERYVFTEFLYRVKKEAIVIGQKKIRVLD